MKSNTGVKEEVLKIDDTAKPTFNPLTNFVGEGEYNIVGCGGIYTVINENNEQMAIKYHISLSGALRSLPQR